MARPGKSVIHQAVVMKRLALGDHHAPFGQRRLHAEAEIADRGAVQEHEHRVRHGEDERAGDRVGQQVAEHDPRRG